MINRKQVEDALNLIKDNDEDILKNGEKIKQIQGNELERLQELNEMKLFKYSDINSKKEQEKLEKERQILLSQCCHDFEDTGSWSREERTCKICNFVITTEKEDFYDFLCLVKNNN